MTVKKPALLKPFAWIAFAALAGGLAGAVAVYVNNRPDANAVLASTPASAADAACALEGAKKASLESALNGAVAGMLPASVPYQTAALSFNKPDSAKTTLADFKGKAVLLNLWATWCVPCRAEMPALDALQAQMGGTDFEVVAVNVENGDPAKRKIFLEQTGVKAMADYNDPELGLFNDLKKRGLVLGLPFTALIGKDGCMLSSMNGPAAWDSADAKALIEAAKGL